MSATRPELAIDLYSDDAIRDPHPSYRAIRACAPDGVWALGRYDDVLHRCAGGHLARLELESLLRALALCARRIEVGEPEVFMNNVLRGYRGFPAALR